MAIKYFHRPDITKKVWDKLANETHLLIPGPRRIGKTSLLYHLRDNPQQGYFPIYVITEAADSLNEFYRKLHFQLTKEDVVGRVEKWSSKAAQSLKKYRITGIGTSGVSLDTAEVNYHDEFTRMIRNLEIDGKIVLMVDEFPQTLENILEYKNEQEAKRLLQTQREIRIDPVLKEKLLFIYAGSIGLENVVSRINATKHIIDLANVIIPTLTPAEAMNFLDQLFADRKLNASIDIKNYLLDKIQWLIPFYIRVVVEELPATTLTTTHIDNAIDELLRCRNYFDHWHIRLKTSSSKEGYLYAKAILNLASTPERPYVTSAEMTDLAVQHDVLDQQIEIVGVLKHDGYLNNSEDPQKYYFNSPIVRLWWWRNIAN